MLGNGGINNLQKRQPFAYLCWDFLYLEVRPQKKNCEWFKKIKKLKQD
jgi:hypothetical protein